jgi:peptidoglycan/xylan/chitin deacetylase (PgdA/CDA1 family)
MNAALLQGTALPPKPVALTFDDGYVDDYTNIFPVLKEYGFTATFFIITGRPDANDPAYLSWSQIREMSDAGMSMESHTKTHSDLRGRDHDFLVYELLGSLQSLAAHTGKEPHLFAYPSGEYDDTTLEMLKSLSVWRAVTTHNGAEITTDNTLELPRLRVAGDTGVNGLAYLLSVHN